MLTITIRDVKKNKTIDLMVNEEQKICNTIAVLKESDIFRADISDFIVHSERTGKRVEPLFSYRDNYLYNGDVLNIEYANDESLEREMTECR